MNELKLYVWDDFESDYYPGLAFAIAHDENEARNLILAQTKVYSWGELKVFPLTEPIAFHVLGGS